MRQVCVGPRLVLGYVYVHVYRWGTSGVAVFNHTGARWDDRPVGITPDRTQTVESSLVKGKGILNDPSGASTDGTR